MKHLTLYPSVLLLFFVSTSLSAQTIVNGDMEGGFTSGAANGWTTWKSPGYIGTFQDGTDKFVSPSHSQKFNLPAGADDVQQLGIYQLVNAASGGFYTFSLKLRTEVGGESYGGEHINVFLGLNPYGGTYLYSMDIEWHELSNDRYIWKTESWTTTARSPLITVFIKTVRKWTYGQQGYAWVDDITVTGPPPQPTYTPSPTITPTPTLPAPVGPELLTNGGFDTFNNGLANGWSSWSTAGNGYWRQSTRLGKAGGGNYWSVDGWYEDAIAMRAKTYLCTQTYGNCQSVGNEPELEDAIIVGRRWFDDRYGEIYNGNYKAVADWLVAHYVQEHQYHPRIDAWQGMNEPDWGYLPNWQRTIEFESYFTDQMHARGLKTVVLNLSVGSPGDIYRMLYAKDLLAKADFLGYHSYGGPDDQLMINNVNTNDPLDYALRVRRYEEMYRIRGWRFPPVIYTEGTTYFGWRGPGFPNESDIRDDLIAFIPAMNADRWCAGLTIFTLGGMGLWYEWDITGAGIAAPVGQANMNDPADKTSGLYSQQFGVGSIHCLNTSCVLDGVFTGGIVQAVSGLLPGQTYRLMFDFKWEHANGTAALTFQYGLDWTGQTSNANAGTIQWSPDLITLYDLPHEIFRFHYDLFSAQSNNVSIWFKSSQSLPSVPYRINLDTVSFQQVSGIPAATNTPGGPTSTPAPVTATPTRTPTSPATATPTAGQGLLNGDMELGFTGGIANYWTRQIANGSPVYSDGTDRVHGGSHSQKVVCPQPASGESKSWLWQVVACQPGQNGTLSAWKNDSVSGADPYALIIRLGYDLSGGTNPQSAGVAWSEFTATPHDSWISNQLNFITTGNTVTVFLEIWHKGWGGTHTAWIDDVSLSGIGGPTVTSTPAQTPPAFTPTPTRTATPVATSTPGSGCGVVQNGDFNSGSAGWIVWNERGTATRDYASLNIPAGAANPCLEMSSTNFNGGVYQALNLINGQQYTLSVLSRDVNSTGTAWAEILIGTAQPQAGSDYTSGNPAGTVLLQKWDTVNCNNWDGAPGCHTNVTAFTAAAGTMYLVLKCGQSFGNLDISFDNVAVCTGAMATSTPSPISTASPTRTPTATSPAPSTATPTATRTATAVPTNTTIPVTSTPTPSPTPIAAATVIIKINPASKTAHHPPTALTPPGAPVPLNIDIEGAANLGAFQFDAVYDPSAIAVVGPADVSLGAFLGSTGNTTIPVGPIINNNNGRVTYGANTLPAHPGPDGNGNLARIVWTTEFVAQKTIVPLLLQNVFVTDTLGNPASIIVQDGEIVLCYMADVDCDDDVDISDIQKVAGRWNTNDGNPMYEPQYDIDLDGDIDIADIQLVAGRWNTSAPFAP